MHTYYEGCIAIVARDYASFLSDAQIPVLEGVSEEDDSEEDLYWSTIELLRDPIAQTVNANRYATPSSSRCWGEAAQLDGKNYPVEKTEAEEWHSTKGCHQCIRQVILVIGLNSVPARLAKFSGHVGIWSECLIAGRFCSWSLSWRNGFDIEIDLTARHY